MSGPPVFAGPKINSASDYTFECTIQYKRVTADDGARFDVVLTFDGVVDETTLKMTTSLEKTVLFNSTDLQGHFGTDVSNMVYYLRQGGYVMPGVCMSVCLLATLRKNY